MLGSKKFYRTAIVIIFNPEKSVTRFIGISWEMRLSHNSIIRYDREIGAMARGFWKKKHGSLG